MVPPILISEGETGGGRGGIALLVRKSVGKDYQGGKGQCNPCSYQGHSTIGKMLLRDEISCALGAFSKVNIRWLNLCKDAVAPLIIHWFIY